VFEGKSCGKTQRARGILAIELETTPPRFRLLALGGVPENEGRVSESALGEMLKATRGAAQPRRREVAIIAERPEEEERERAGDQPGPEDPGDLSHQREPPTDAEVSRELSREILRIHAQAYGTGAGKAQAIVEGDWVVIVLDELELQPNEKFLIDKGKAEVVSQVRTQYQLAIQSTFSAAVERATGRTVIGFSSATSVEEPRFATEIFKLR
jgi:uncharacterized protein YbcI